MNLLVLTPLIPAPPHDGDKLRLYYFLKELKKRGHVIDLFCLTRVKRDLADVELLRPLCRTIYAEHLTDLDLFLNLLGGSLFGYSLNLASYFSPKLRDALRGFWKKDGGRKIDVVLAHRLRMAPMAFEGNPGVPVVLELTDCLSAYAGSVKALEKSRWVPQALARWDYGLLQREETQWGNQSAATVTISNRDAAALEEGGVSSDKIKVIPNGLAFDSKVRKWKRPESYPARRPVICFAGNMGYFPNEDGIFWFHREVWPLVKQAVPDAFLAAVGGQPRKALKKLSDEKDFLVTGWVPEIEPYMAGAQVTIAPLRVAAGMQNKVALSLGLGVPVVATPAAAGWMEPKARSFLSVAEDPIKFAQAVIEILRKPAQAKRAARKGRAFILKNYPWAKSGRKMEEVLKLAVKKGKS